MQKNILIAGLALASSAAAMPAMAQVDASVGVASEYIFRGIESGSPQVWGAVDYSHGSGLYAGTWISNTSFGSEELDLYAGYGMSLSEGVDLDVGAIFYTYPSLEESSNITEYFAGINAAGFSGYVWFAPAGVNGPDDDDYIYLDANYEMPLGSTGVTMGAHVGYTMQTGSAFDGAEDDTYFDFGVSASMGDFWLAVTYLEENTASAGLNAADAPSVSVGYSWSFENVVAGH